MQSSTGNITYADVGPLAQPNLREGAAFTVICDDDGVEYAKLNHNLMQNAIPLSSVETTNEGIIIIILCIPCNNFI